MKDCKSEVWLFVYFCPFFRTKPSEHRKHVRWVVIEDELEAEFLARSNDLPWPSSRAIKGCIEFITVHEKITDWDAFVENYLAEVAKNCQDILKRLRSTRKARRTN